MRHEHRLDILRRNNFRTVDDKPRIHFSAFQSEFYVPPRAILTQQTDGKHGADAKRAQVIKYRTPCARRLFVPENLPGGKPRFQRRLVKNRVNEQPTVQKQVTDDRNPYIGQFFKQRFKTPFVHYISPLITH